MCLLFFDIFFINDKYNKNIYGGIINNLEEKINIKDMIYEVRGKQVMLDSDLAMLYKCKNGTKSINLAVKRHVNRFPERFMFRLTEEECKNILRFQIETLNSKGDLRGQHVKYLPYVFTEQGVAMLSSVLRTNVAEEVSIKIMDAFVAMRHYIGNNEYRLSNVEAKIIEHDKSIKLLQDTFDEFDKKKKETDIYFNGQFYDAYYKVHQICNSAKKELVIVDNYADNTLLDIIKRLKVNVTIITKPNNLLTKQDIEKYNKQYHNLKVVFNNTFHDRYFIIDSREVYHCGSSVNKIGSKTFSINKNNDDGAYDSLIERINKIVL